nr:hypothetical protein GCM10020093_045200 [Planobispora longispora]
MFSQAGTPSPVTAVEVDVRAARAETGRHSPRTGRWSVLVLLCLSLLLITVDATVLHIAVPALTSALEPSSVQLLWIIDVYSLVVAPLLLTFGTLGDRFGRRRLVLIGYLVFGAASAAAAFAPTPTPSSARGRSSESAAR